MYTMKHIEHLREREREGRSSVQVRFLQTVTELLFFQKLRSYQAWKSQSFLSAHLTHSNIAAISKRRVCRTYTIQICICKHEGKPKFFCIVHDQLCVFTIFMCWHHLFTCPCEDN